MGRVELVPASPAHVGRIANRMRPADVLEVTAFGHSPKHALRLGIVGSLHATTALVDGKPEAMFGLTPVSLLDGIGAPWMLGSEAIYAHGRELIRMGPAILAGWLDSTPRLENLVGRFNGPAIRLLRRWGFRIGEEVIVSAGVEFVAFSMTRADV